MARFQLDSGIRIIAKLKGIQDHGLIGALKLVNVKTAQKPKLMVLAAYEAGKVTLIDWANAHACCSLDISPCQPLTIDFDKQTQAGAVAGNEDLLLSFSVTSEDDAFALVKLKQRSMPTKGVSALVIRTTCKSPIVAAACWDKTVRLFSWVRPERLKPLGALKFHRDGVQAVDFVGESEGKRMLVAVGKDKKVSLWDVYNS